MKEIGRFLLRLFRSLNFVGRSVNASGGRVYYFKDIINLLLLTKTKG